jgi:DNA-binding CsgD family transcriptional regulator
LPEAAVFLDRTEERRALDSLAESAREHGSGALVFYGDAGMGKTALLDYAASLSGWRVERIAGIETEQEFGFAALHRLLFPFLDGLGELPLVQQTALQGALGLLDQGPADRFMVGLAALNLLAVGSARTPLVCLIDDAQWIDAESLVTLAFVARRIRAEGIVLLFAIRNPFDVPSELAGIPAMEIGGLPIEAAGELLERAAGRELAADLTARIVSEMNGCPLALSELGKEFAEEYVADRRAPMEQVTIRHRLEDHFFLQMAMLPSDAQLLLLVAAADTSGDRALVLHVAWQLGCGIDAQLDAERQRLLLPGPVMRFRHPLIRSTVYARSDPSQRRLVHRALAAAMGKNAFPDRWARHVALGAEGPNEELATELEDMSQLAQARGGYWAQATLLVQAADLSESLDSRALRLLKAASAAQKAGAHPYAAELLGRAEGYLSDPVAIAESGHLRGLLAIGLTQPASAPALLLRAAESFMPLNMTRAREVLLESSHAYNISGQFTEEICAIDIAKVVDITRAASDEPTLQDLLLEGMAALYRGDRSWAYGHLSKVADLLRDGKVSDYDVAKWSSLGLEIATEMFDDETYNLWCARADSYSRQSGALFVLLFTLFGEMHRDVRSGKIRDAEGRHAQALDVAAAIGLPAEFFSAMDNLVRAWSGDEEGTQAAAAEAIEINSVIGSDQVVTSAHWALAILHIGAGRYEAALAETDIVCQRNVVGFSGIALPVVVEAASRLGEIDKAKSALADLEERAAVSATPWARGLLACSKALLADSSEAEAYYLEAIDLLSQTSISTEVGRTRLLYGEWLRRERRRVEARTQLRIAHEYFTDIGATSFAKRAGVELLATGERARPRSVERTEDLTSQERRVAELASDGFSNREIASQMFISAATVEYHLGKVYRKLGIKSRGRLKAALGSFQEESP